MVSSLNRSGVDVCGERPRVIALVTRRYEMAFRRDYLNNKQNLNAGICRGIVLV